MSAPEADAAGRHDDFVYSSIVVDAQPSVVYDAIRSQRQVDPARKLISTSGNEAVIDERYSGLPVIGSARCIYKEVESAPNARMDYELIKSDKFKSFQGTWLLTPVGDDRTEVRLTSKLDTGLHIPFARQITNSAVMKDVQRRLTRVKDLAEHRQQ
ncbi:MAG TPA: SRPBCC family protein [Candidatus Obscuribacterales bacterium]